jgi:hypothetical protein
MSFKLREIETRLEEIIVSTPRNVEIAYGLLEAYGKPKTTITQLRNGRRNLSHDPHTVALRRDLYFQFLPQQNLHSVINTLTESDEVISGAHRFVVVTDGKRLLAVDRVNREALPLDISLAELPHYAEFFLPWAGMEKARYRTESVIDEKAARKMADLYDEIRKHNPQEDPETTHALHLFFARLLFCFFAEDTDLFKKNQFSRSIESHTQRDGSDLAVHLGLLFHALNTEHHVNAPSYIQSFPYVNGGLFAMESTSLQFSAQARKLIIDGGDLSWANINPDIFGSMIRAGMHYTSTTNIMKVLDPLFLDNLREEFEKSYDSVPKLDRLLKRLGTIHVFDPACGSGNFLIIAYKELRTLENAILERILNLDPQRNVLFHLSEIKLDHFYGIELEDFAYEAAILSLWLAKHQMNLEFHEHFGVEQSTLPLLEAGHIVHGNAARLDWSSL